VVAAGFAGVAALLELPQPRRAAEFADRDDERQERLELLRRWRDESTVVTYVCRENAGALLDERSLLADALTSTPEA